MIVESHRLSDSRGSERALGMGFLWGWCKSPQGYKLYFQIYLTGLNLVYQQARRYMIKFCKVEDMFSLQRDFDSLYAFS